MATSDNLRQAADLKQANLLLLLGQAKAHLEQRQQLLQATEEILKNTYTSLPQNVVKVQTEATTIIPAATPLTTPSEEVAEALNQINENVAQQNNRIKILNANLALVTGKGTVSLDSLASLETELNAFTQDNLYNLDLTKLASKLAILEGKTLINSEDLSKIKGAITAQIDAIISVNNSLKQEMSRIRQEQFGQKFAANDIIKQSNQKLGK